MFRGPVIPQNGEISSESMIKIRAHHRDLHTRSTELGGKGYGCDTITTEAKGEKAWKALFGDNTWESFVSARCKFDPCHSSCPGVDMWNNNADNYFR